MASDYRFIQLNAQPWLGGEWDIAVLIFEWLFDKIAGKRACMYRSGDEEIRSAGGELYHRSQ